MLVQTCNTLHHHHLPFQRQPLMSVELVPPPLYSDRYSLCSVLEMKEDWAYLRYGQWRGSHLVMPQQSDEKISPLFFLKLAAGIYAVLLLKDIQVHILSSSLLTKLFFFLHPQKRKKAAQGYSAQGVPGSVIFHCEVLKVTVHS